MSSQTEETPRGAPGCTCGTPPYAPPEPSDDCPFHRATPANDGDEIIAIVMSKRAAAQLATACQLDWGQHWLQDGRRIAVPDGDAPGPSFAVAALAEFHEHPNALPETTNTQALRQTLHDEEHDELMTELEAAAAGDGDLEKIAREIADVLYVTYGTAWAFGIDADAAFAEVHRAAMDKMNAGLRRDDGKILKPPGFRPPDMTAAVQGARLDADGTGRST